MSLLHTTIHTEPSMSFFIFQGSVLQTIRLTAKEDVRLLDLPRPRQ